MDKQDKKRIARVAEEAAKLMRDYPNLKFGEALEKAREIYGIKDDLEKK